MKPNAHYKTLILQFEASGKCPFCGKNIAFGSIPAPFSTHALPTCETFNRLDTIRFLEAVNRCLEIEQSIKNSKQSTKDKS